MLKILDHPLIQKDLAILRNEITNGADFRSSLKRIGSLLAFELTADIKLDFVEIKTPMEKTSGAALQHDVVLLPVMRAGLGLMSAFQDIIPEAKIGLIGLKRNEENFKAVEYYYNMPPAKDPLIIILEIMIATGGSTCDTIARLKLEGYNNIKVASVISAPEGLEKIKTDYPEVDVVSAAMDRELNDKKYILPGLGDAGDRFCG
jgi:uracil phosphoribosyltransferase